MILLQGHSLTAQEKFTPESMQLTLEERRSQATLTVGPAAPAISVGDWMRDDTEPGSGILWRVKSVSHQIDRDTRTIALEHISATLRDYVIFGEWEPEEGCTAQEAVAYALGQTGGLWVTGTWEAANPSNPYKFASTNVMSALENVSATIGGVFWEYDLTQIPFRLHFRLIPDAAASEMRMNRNIVSLRRSIDRSRMYTRIYPIGADDLHITGDYLSKNEAIYGIVSHIETNQGIENEAELAAWAQQRLDTHCEPAVSIQISGLDYSRETGEALDALAIGTRCRVPLPEYGTTILETLTRLTWKDKIGKPEEVTVNLANIQEDVASIFKKVAGDAASNSRAGGRGSKKKKEEDHAWFVDTTDHVAMVAEAIIGRADGETPEHLWSRVSTIVVDGEGIHQRVTANADGIAMHGTAIEQNENAISLAVGTYQIDPDKIQRYPGGTGSFPSEGQTGYYYLDTSVTPNRMYIWKDGKYNLLQVSGDGAKGFLIKAGEIAIALNESGDAEAHIDAKKVVIGSGISQESLPDWMDTTEGLIADKATVGQLNALTARVGTLESDTIKTTNLSAAFTNLGSASIATLTADNLYIKPNAGMGGVSVAGALTNLRLQESGGTYTLQCLKFNSSSWEDVGTFSRAASTSKASGSWSGSTFTVSADPNGSYLPVSTSVYLTAEGTPNPGATVYAKIYKDNPSVAENQLDALEMTLQENARSQTVTLVVNTLTKGSVSTAATYRAGWYASMAEIEVLPDEDVTLNPGESHAVTVKGRAGPGGGLYTLSSFTISAAEGSGTSRVSGAWSGTTYTVSANAGGQALPINTSVYLTAEGTANPGATVYAKVYKDNPSVAENQLDALEMTLQENVSSKTVTLVANTLTKGSISTQATYNRGWLDSYGEIEVLPDEDVTLSAGESQTVTVKAKTSPSGNLVTVSSFTISAAGTATNRVSGAWNGTTYTVSSNSSGQALPINTSVFLTVEGTANPGATVYAKIYKNDPSVSANQLTSTAMTLTENVNSKTVTLTANSLTKGSISTQATYNAGWLASYNVIEVLPDEDVTLGYGESQTVTVKAKTSPSGNLTTVSSFTITAPAAPSANKVTGSWSGTTYTVSASSGGQSLPINTSVYLAVEGTANPGATIYAKIYKDSPSVSANQLTSTAMTLTENVSSRTVTLTANSLTKGSISTQATYNAGQQALISAGGPFNTTSNGSGRLDRYVTTYSVDVDTGGQTIVAAPVFTLPTTLGSGSTRTSITVTATSSASGQTPAATTTNMILQTGTYTSSGTTKYCAEIYSVNESRVIARRDITELVSGAASTASVEFYRWMNTTGSNAGAGNTIRFINANNSSKYADRSIQLVENDGWVYANDTTDGTRVAQIQESGGSTAGVHLKAEWNAANTSVTVSKVTTGSMNTVTFNISAAAFAEYDSTTHKYTAYGQAKVNNVEKGAVASYVSGTEAYEAGQTAGWEQGNSDGAAAAWNAARQVCTTATTYGTGETITVNVPSATIGVATPLTYTLQQVGDNTVVLDYDQGAGGAGVIVAQIGISTSHSPTASVTMNWTGSIGNRTRLATATASSLARTYILIDAKCGGKTKGYYITLN